MNGRPGIDEQESTPIPADEGVISENEPDIDEEEDEDPDDEDFDDPDDEDLDDDETDEEEKVGP